MSDPAVEVRNLSVAFALENVSVDVATASLHVLAGPNGAGKSTFLSAVLGQVPFEGSIRLRLSGPLAYVPQRFHVDRTLPVSVLDFLALSRTRRPACLGVSAAVKKTASGLLERVGLAGFERRSLGALSGGELQRVLLANALDPTPSLLLLDEPATGLDKASQARLEAELIQLKAAGVTVVMVSHDFDQARRIADRVTLLEGKVVADGPPGTVL